MIESKQVLKRKASLVIEINSDNEVREEDLGIDRADSKALPLSLVQRI